MLFGLKYADILKISEEELEFLTGTGDLQKGSQQFLDHGVSIVIVTLGPKGCFFRCAEGFGTRSTYDTKVIDTTGAGDCFFGSILYQISQFPGKLEEIRLDDLKNMADFSNAAGALCASKKGAISAMPTIEEIEDCMKQVPLLLS